MKTMTRSGLIVALALAVFGPTAVASADGKAASASADPDALQILKRMTDYLGALQSFSMHTENSFEDVLDSGQKIQYDFASSVVIERPDKLRAERTDGNLDQTIVYDGETLVVYDGSHDLFAEVTAPDNLDDTLHFARDTLDLVPPAGDMIYSDAYQLLTAGLTCGFVVGSADAAAVASANAQAAASQQEAAAAQQQAAAAQQQAAAAQPQAPAPAPTPMITSLPAGCVNTGQVYQCGNVYYKPYLQGTTVVYAQVPAPQ